MKEKVKETSFIMDFIEDKAKILIQKEKNMQNFKDVPCSSESVIIG